MYNIELLYKARLITPIPRKPKRIGQETRIGNFFDDPSIIITP